MSRRPTNRSLVLRRCLLGMTVVALGLLSSARSGPAGDSAAGDLLPKDRALAEPGRPSVRKDAWLRLETPHFTFFGEVPEARLRLVADRLESFRSALEALHPGSRPSPRDTYVYVFRDAKSGRPYAPVPAVWGIHPLGANQQYDAPNYFIVAAPGDDPPLEVLYHSYAHQFLDDNFPRLPLMITEGLAEFYSGFAMTHEGTLIGMVNHDHVRWLRENGALPLAQQLSLDTRSPLLTTENGRMAFVAESWALMHFLASGSGEMRSRLPAFLEALQRGNLPGEAAPSALGTSLDQLQQDVNLYIQGDRFLPLRIKAENPGSNPPLSPPDVSTGGAAPPSNPGGIRLRAMGEDEALAALGDLLGHARPDRVGDAQAYQREALRLNPSQARAYAGLGYLSYSQKHFEAAVPFLERAVEIEADAMSCYLLARSLLKIDAAIPATAPSPASLAGPTSSSGAAPASAAAETPERVARARALLARAIQLRPLFAAPYVTLGATHSLPDGDVPAGIALLQKARLMLPARTDIASTLVYFFLRQGDFIRAEKLIDEALVHGGDDAALAGARAALATFQENLTARQSLYRPAKTKDEEARDAAVRLRWQRTLREAIDSTTDPAVRAKLEALLKASDGHSTALPYEVAEIYNEAVDRANKRDYASAISLLEGLLPKVDAPELKGQITSLLVRLRQDANRPRLSDQ